MSVWHLDTGRFVSLAVGDFQAQEVSTDAQLAVVGSILGTLCLVDTSEGRLLQMLDSDRSEARSRQILDILVDTAAGRVIAAARDGTVRSWDLASGRETGACVTGATDVDAVAIAPSGRFVYSVVGDTVLASDLTAQRQLGRLSLDDHITSMTVMPDGLHVVLGDESGRVHFLDPPALRRDSPATSAATTSDGPVVARRFRRSPYRAMDTLSSLHRSPSPPAVKLILFERRDRHDAEEAVVAAAGVGEDLGEIERVSQDVQRRVVAILPAIGRKTLPVHRGHVHRPGEDWRIEPQLERRGLLRTRLVAELDAFDLLVVLSVLRAGAGRADEDTRGCSSFAVLRA